MTLRNVQCIGVAGSNESGADIRPDILLWANNTEGNKYMIYHRFSLCVLDRLSCSVFHFHKY